MSNYRGFSRTFSVGFLLFSLLFVYGCRTVPERSQSTADNGVSNRFMRAAKSAFYDFGTWPLLLGAAAFRVSEYDSKLTEFAMERKPLFSNNETAARSTDLLRSFDDALTMGTALAVNETWSDKGRRIVMESGALFLTRFRTTQMNERVNREYPDGSGDDAFGSHHAASPFAAAALTRRNVDSIDMPDWASISINVSSYVAATASAWGRIEMGLHYPSDQLVSAAIGNFTAIFLHDAFVSEDVMLGFTLLPGGSYLALRIHF